ncbi:MAG: hypothetical protein ACKO9Q_04150 [Pirellula sp.]
MTNTLKTKLINRSSLYLFAIGWAIGCVEAQGFQAPAERESVSGATSATVDLSCVFCHSNANALTGDRSIGLMQASVFLGQENGIPPEERQSDVHARAVDKVWKKDGQLSEDFQKILQKLKSQNSANQDSPWSKLDLDKVNDKEVDSVFLDNCLTCHAGILVDSKRNPLEPSALELGRPWSEFVADRSAISSGSIGCEACHGRGVKYVFEHIAPEWITYEPRTKMGKGFADLENSAIAARVCLSCHLGEPSESKVVTHEMYAAGHPPLPPFDLAKFLDETCKKHWMELNTKSEKWTKASSSQNDPRVEYLRKHFKETQDSAAGDLDAHIQGHFRKAQQSRVGQVMASLMSQDLMHYNSQNKQLFGDYGVYDCVGCHQTLYKQVRGATGLEGRVPGRPMGLMWTRTALSNLSHPGLAPIQVFQQRLDLDLNKTPFGSPLEIQKSFSEFKQQRSSAKEHLMEVACSPLDQQQADAWLVAFLQDRQALMGNEWVAKQVYWSLGNYFDDLDRVTAYRPQSVSKISAFRGRFFELVKTAPPVSQIVSCGQTNASKESSRDYATFFEQLKTFVDELVANEATKVGQPPAQ